MFGPYKLGKTLGQGEFGKVKFGIHTKTFQQVAVKLVKKDTIVQANKKEKLVREITILKQIKHRFIVNLYEVLETDSYIGMAMEYASGGELFNHILAKKRLKESEAARFFTQLIIGVSYLHSKGIVHRDLKLENLLLDRNRNIIITDFGFANRVSIDGDSFLSTSCGSPCYAAPELVINECYSGEAADIWSCGVILYAMICGYLPFDDDPKNQDGENINLLYEYILKTELNFPKHTSVLAKSLINRMLVTSPSERATMQEIKMHRWLEPMRMLFVQEEAMHPPAVSKTNEETLRVTTSNDSEILLKKDSSEGEKSPLGVVSATLTERTSISSSKVPNSTAANVDDTSIAFGRKSADARNGAEGYQHQYEIRAQSMDCRGRFVESKGLSESFQALQSRPNPFIHQFGTAPNLRSLKNHTGPIDPKAISSKPPNELLELIMKVGASMGLEIARTSNPYKLKLYRIEDNTASRNNLTSKHSKQSQNSKVGRLGSRITNYPTEILQRIKYMGMFGLQYNRGYSGSLEIPSPSMDSVKDNLGPLKMVASIHKIKNLNGLVTVDLKRVRGDMWQFKRLYHEFIDNLKLGFRN